MRPALLVLGFLVLAPAAVAQTFAPDEGPEGYYGAAMRWYSEGARRGDPQAQFFHALRLERGVEGVAPDPAEAVRWFRAAAEQGHALAQYKLALALSVGADGKAEPAEVRRWYRAAAEQGVAAAAFNLALMLEAGQGGPADLPEAATWYERAARGGVHVALRSLGALATRLPAPDADARRANLVAAWSWLTLAERRDVEGAAELRARLRDALDAEMVAEGERRAAAW